MNARRVRWLLAAASIVWAGQAVAANPKGSPAVAGYQPVGSDEKGLWARADESERALKTSKLLLRDAELDAYLHSVLCREVGAERCGAARIYVVREPHFNVRMYPNGMVTIFTGALLRMRNEAELAAVLGHEFGHFEARHSLSTMQDRRITGSMIGWVSLMSVGASVQDQGTAFWTDHYRFSAEEEQDADRRGLQDLARGGYRMSAARQVWANLDSEAAATGAARGTLSVKDAPQGLFASHPMTGERMKYLGEQADLVGAGSRFDGAAEYRAAVSPFWPTMMDDQIKLNDFGGSEYLLASLATDGWTGPLLYARGELYRARGRAGDFQQAAVFYREATTKADAPPQAWRGLGLALARSSDRPGARLALNEYLTRNPQAGDKPMLMMIQGSGK